MPRIGIWNSGRKGNDYKFIDRVISEFFGTGTAAYIHLYEGPYQQTYPMYDQTGVEIPPDPSVVPPTPGVVAPSPSVTSIQDVLFMETRDRKYGDTVYELRTVYSVADSDFDLRQFGLFLSADTLFLEFHYNDMIALLGRRIMAGDVIELPHQRDLDLLDINAPAINKFYVVQDASKASDGYSATWFPHIWRVKVTPMTGAAEYSDILGQDAINPLGLDQGQTIGSLMDTLGAELGVSDAVVQSAIAHVPKRNFETQQFWIAPGAETAGENPWVFAGDGIPPNGAVLLGSGTAFPQNAATGTYYLRTDYSPATLFLCTQGQWTVQEFDWRGTSWNVANRLLYSFINNTNTATIGGVAYPEKQNLSKTVRPRADF